MQTLYLATILDGPFSADHTTCEIVLGIPPWSLFIMRIKLKMYYRIFKQPQSIFDDIIRLNYLQAFEQYKGKAKLTNRDHWQYCTLDYMETLRSYGLHSKYENINDLPNRESDWIQLLNDQYMQIYLKELKQWQHKKGWILTQIIGEDYLRSYINKPYKSMIPILRQLLNKETITTTDIGKISLIAFNWHKISYLNKRNWTHQTKRCAMCEQIRVTSTAEHLVMNCGKYVFGTLWKSKNVHERVQLIMRIQLEADALLEEEEE